MAVDAIFDHLRAKAGASDDWQVAVELEDGQVAPLVAAGDSIKSPEAAEPWIGHQSFEFRLPTADGAARLEIAAQVSLPPAVVIAMHVLPKGTIVRASDVQLKRLKPGIAPGELFQTIEDVVGKEAVRNIPVGQTLDANFVHAAAVGAHRRSGDGVRPQRRESWFACRREPAKTAATANS